MDEKIRRLEHEVMSVKGDINEVKSDIRLQNSTLEAINETLREIKKYNNQLHQIEMRLSKEDGELNNLNNQVKALYHFKSDIEARTRILEKSDTVKSVKIGGAETIYLIVVTAVIGVAVTLFKG